MAVPTAAHELGLIEPRQAREARSQSERPPSALILECLISLLQHPIPLPERHSEDDQEEDETTDLDRKRRAHERQLSGASLIALQDDSRIGYGRRAFLQECQVILRAGTARCARLSTTCRIGDGGLSRQP